MRTFQAKLLLFFCLASGFALANDGAASTATGGIQLVREPWLTSAVFSQQIQPLLTKITTSAIRSRIGVSRWYAARIREGYIPHQRHWVALAALIGLSA